MERMISQTNFFETESVWKILVRIAPPVMLAQLIQALYNIVDSYFVGHFSGDGLTALSVMFPIQLVITAFSIGIGTGVNILIARLYAQKHYILADHVAGAGSVLAFLAWVIFSIAAYLLLPGYVRTSASSPDAVSYAITYGNIVCIGSLGIFLESTWTKIHQAGGNMRLPMIAQITGALINIILDLLLIFGLGPFPRMGIAGAAIATIIGQFAAAAITGQKVIHRPPRPVIMLPYFARILKMGSSYILMQVMCTVYIMVLNVILAGFSDGAVTVLGLYYKFQSFFFIPLLALMTCIVPVLSYNFACKNYTRCKQVLLDSSMISLMFMAIGFFCFECLPTQLISLFSTDSDVLAIGVPAFRIIGISFFSAVFSLITPIFFQAIGELMPSLLLSLTRPVFCLMPIFWLLSLRGLSYTWLAFPAAETITGILGVIMCMHQMQKWK